MGGVQDDRRWVGVPLDCDGDSVRCVTLDAAQMALNCTQQAQGRAMINIMVGEPTLERYAPRRPPSRPATGPPQLHYTGLDYGLASEPVTPE